MKRPPPKERVCGCKHYMRSTRVCVFFGGDEQSVSLQVSQPHVCVLSCEESWKLLQHAPVRLKKAGALHPLPRFENGQECELYSLTTTSVSASCTSVVVRVFSCPFSQVCPEWGRRGHRLFRVCRQPQCRCPLLCRGCLGRGLRCRCRRRCRGCRARRECHRHREVRQARAQRERERERGGSGGRYD